MTKQRRNFDNQFFYHVAVNHWDAHVSFNDYAHINIFDKEPFEESTYICLSGTLESTLSKKIKEGLPAEVVIHPSKIWDKLRSEDYNDLRIGDLIIQRNPKRLLARVSVPMRSYELIRSYMTYKPSGTMSVVGTEIQKNKADIFYASFDSKNYGDS